jgi:HAD superfamily hydrolase (TIGR01509 family)
MSQLNTVIFDMDGLMIDSEKVAERVYVETLASFGHVMPRELYNQLVGTSAESSLQRVIDTFHLSLSSIELDELMRVRWHELVNEGIPALTGLFELVAELARRGIRWGVASASERWYIEQNLANLGLTDVCQAVAAGDEVVNNKPAPDVYLLAAQRLHVNPANCLVFEDSEPGCRAAAAAGMQVVAVPNEYTVSAEFPCAFTRCASLSAAIHSLNDWFPVNG